MLQELKILEQEVNKIEMRRDYTEKRHRLEAELVSARTDQTRQVNYKTTGSTNFFSFRNYLKFNINLIN